MESRPGDGRGRMKSAQNVAPLEQRLQKGGGFALTIAPA